VSAGHRVKARDLMEAHVRSITEFYRGDLGSQMDDFIDWR
jgi:hypothetical protein